MLYGYIVLATASTLFMTSCDDHIDFPDVSIKVGDILCTDGDILHMDDYLQSGKEAIGVVFYLNHDEDVEGSGYAVYLRDLDPQAMSDSCGVSQKTSTDLTAFDGNSNTYALMDNQVISSPLAESVFELWKFGQSAYIPSVAQCRLLFSAKTIINPVISACGGEELSDLPEDTWYWTSTEVEGQSEQKAWLFSMQSGTIQETPKTQAHKSRPVITINH